MNLWLARLRPDLRNRHARDDLRDAAALHRRIMSLLPDGIGEDARRKAGVLYRLDETRDGPVILIQARLKPAAERVPPHYGEFALLDLDRFIASLRLGMYVHYRIAANASKRLSKSDSQHRAGQVIALSGSAAGEWWQRQATARGLTLVTTFAQPLPQVRGQRRDGNRIRHAVTRFDGVGIVRDVKLIREAVTDGIGRGKSYGCGLLSLAPIRRTP